MTLHVCFPILACPSFFSSTYPIREWICLAIRHVEAHFYYICLRLLYNKEYGLAVRQVSRNACAECLDVALPADVVLDHKTSLLTSAPGEMFLMAIWGQLRASDLSWSLLQPASLCCPQKLLEVTAAKGACFPPQTTAAPPHGLGPVSVPMKYSGVRCLSLKFAHLSKVPLTLVGVCRREIKKVNKLSQSTSHRVSC